MLELLQESISPLNLPFTILLGAVGLYWIIGLFGLVDLEGGFDGIEGVDGVDGLDGVDGVDADGIEGRGNHDLTGDGDDTAVGATFFHGVLRLVGASDAPLIFVISVFSVFLWALNIAGNHYFNTAQSSGFATMMVIPVVVVAFVMTRLLIRPLRPVMNMLRTSEKPAQIIGASGRVRSMTLDSEFGQIEVEAEEKSLILKAVLSSGDPIAKGTGVLVVSYTPETETYIVRPLD